MTDAEKREKAIRGLEAHANPKTCETCAGEYCPYYDRDGSYTAVTCSSFLAADALALLKEQEARVMDAEEVARLTEEIYQWLWIEEIPTTTWNLYCLRTFVYSKHPDTGEFYILAIGYRDTVKLEGDEYGKTWRCWTSCPTPEQMRGTKWEEDKNDDSN